ncbi:hypothetical protein U9M49_20340 [Cytobacillus sp. OWB-43]|uniref:hypothetical protein n=1 Tax=Cytobacillus sp. OWB-43 TaxID=3108468 RepID=UPI002AFEF9D4|nr:hypothetical protein [Cytobacillus sp. OWB-43]MEA1855416.1 hypothetical protein [Cytobacillus sp. OWB-43]
MRITQNEIPNESEAKENCASLRMRKRSEREANWVSASLRMKITNEGEAKEICASLRMKKRSESEAKWVSESLRMKITNESEAKEICTSLRMRKRNESEAKFFFPQIECSTPVGYYNNGYTLTIKKSRQFA